MSLDRRSLLSEQTDFPAECVVFHVYLHVMIDTLQSNVKSHFILRMVRIFKSIHSWADLASSRRASNHC